MRPRRVRTSIISKGFDGPCKTRQRIEKKKVWKLFRIFSKQNIKQNSKVKKKVYLREKTPQ